MNTPAKSAASISLGQDPMQNMAEVSSAHRLVAGYGKAYTIADANTPVGTVGKALNAHAKPAAKPSLYSPVMLS
jgi:hypothetical protein